MLKAGLLGVHRSELNIRPHAFGSSSSKDRDTKFKPSSVPNAAVSKQLIGRLILSYWKMKEGASELTV